MNRSFAAAVAGLRTAAILGVAAWAASTTLARADVTYLYKSQPLQAELGDAFADATLEFSITLASALPANRSGVYHDDLSVTAESWSATIGPYTIGSSVQPSYPDATFIVLLDTNSSGQIDAWGFTIVAETADDVVVTLQGGWVPGNGGDAVFSAYGRDADAIFSASNIGVSPTPGTFYVTAPEPSTWAMALLGFAGTGIVGYRSSRKTFAA
jgi:hypothetical protein